VNYKTYSSEGFVLSRKNYGEGDRILILFTKDFGKISVMAKGVRKLTSKKRGGIEMFSQIKFSAVKGKSLDILTEVQVINSLDNLKKDLRKISVAYYFCEVTSKVTREDERQIHVYELLEKYFNKLDTSRNIKVLRLSFVKDLLQATGFWPENTVMDDPDKVLEGIIERKINSSRIGKRMLRKN
jgi:DNA repair protein RecO (recombination protein O)